MMKKNILTLTAGWQAMSTMKPCVISNYEKEDDKTSIGTRNAGVPGEMFGGEIVEVMAEARQDQDRFIGFAMVEG